VSEASDEPAPPAPPVASAPNAAPSAPGAPSAANAPNVGRGALALVGNNVLFIFAGMLLQFGLPSALSRSAFGAYTTINGIASWINGVVVTGTIQMVSKFTAAEPEKARAFQRAGLRLHLGLAIVIALGFFAAAPLVAWLLHDPTKTAPIMLAGLISAIYAVYAVFVGTANGLKQLGKQAALSTIFAYVRAALMVGMAVAGLGLLGVISGWIAAAVLILLLAVVWIGMPGREGPVAAAPVKPMAKFFLGVAVYFVLFNLLMFVDTFLLKRLITEHYTAHAGELSAAFARVLPWATHTSGYHVVESVLADVQVGYYGAVQNLARLSYQVTLAAAFAVFPLMSRATFDGDPDLARRYVGITIRYTMIGAAAIAVAMIANPGDVLGLVYAPDFVERGASALPYLAIGNIAFSVIAGAAAILNSAGQTRTAAILAGLTLVIAIAGNYVAIPLAAERGIALEVAAAVTGGAMVIGAILYGIVLYRRFGAFVPPLSVVRVAAATAIATVAGHALPLHGKVMTLVKAAAVVVVFLVVLVATRELGARDVEAIKAVRRKRAPQGEAT
jgi:O-antigen/teichoic acid export membrane protein